MPELNHKTDAAQAKQIVEAAIDPKISATELEKAVAAVLAKNRHAAVEAAKPKEPDWSKLTEQDAYNTALYIPVIEHELPDYMNMKLKDTEYEVVWASRDQRRIGQLQAEGYEFLKPEHVSPNFKLPLLFDSEGLYRYQDVVAMRVHKRILYSKRRKGLEVSQRQLRNNHRPPSTRVQNTFELGESPNPDFGSLYVPNI